MSQVRHDNSNALEQERYRKSDLRHLTGRMAGKLLSSFSWWLPPRRRSIMHGCTALDGTQDSPSELLGTRVTPFCPLLHASLQCAGRVMAGVQLWSKVAQAMRCCRLPLPELAYFDYWCGIRAQIKARAGVNRWPDSGRVLYACAPRYSKDVALRTQCMRNAERNRAPLSRLLGCTMNCMAGADREPFPLPWKACIPMQMTVL